MAGSLTGSQIVAGFAQERPFWRIAPQDIQGWVDTLPPSATAKLESGVEWIGEAWDGTSNVPIGRSPDGDDERVTASEILTLLKKLRSGMSSLGLGAHTLPDVADVRICVLGSGDELGLTIDVDLDDFILPLCIDRRRWNGQRRSAGIAAIADGMLTIIRAADAARAGIARRERTFRRALENATTRIGAGAAPLWLRLEPVAYYEDGRNLRQRHYVMLLLRLNDQLIWTPFADERVDTVQDIHHYGASLAESQRRRAARLGLLQAEGVRGYIDEVALAVLDNHGLDPAETFRRAADAALAESGRDVIVDQNGFMHSLFVTEGALLVRFVFEGGHFDNDTLTLWGNYPPSIANTAKGRPLSDFVDHPALIRSGVLAAGGSLEHGALEIRCNPRFISVEAAASR